MRFELVKRMDEQVTKPEREDGPAWMEEAYGCTHTFSVLEVTNHMLA